MTLATAVRRGQRFTAERPCPICAGWSEQPRGKGLRCFGYLGTDGKYAHCTREDCAGGLTQEAGGTFAHKLEGDCRCGHQHGAPPLAHLDDQRSKRDRGEPIRELVYDYEGGLRVIRKDFEGGDKTFLQYHRNGSGYVPGRGDAPLTLFRAPELRETPLEAFVFFVEGEKCVEALRRNGLCATTTPQGSGNFKHAAERAVEFMKGRHVVVLPDHDDPGDAYAKEAIAAFMPVAASLRRLDLPGLDKGEDVVDWIIQGGEPEDLVRMALARTDLVADRPGRIHWISTSQIFEPLPPTNWIFRELGICPGRPSMIAGYGYSGKTLAGQALLLAAGAGAPAWGHFPTGKQLRVRHLDFEQGRHATLKRYQRLAIGVGISPSDLGDRLEVAIFPPAALNAKDAADIYARESENWDLVLLDSLAGATPGEPENESTMRGYIDMLSRASEKTGAVFNLIHHAGKLTDNHSKDPRTIVRGHSGIFDACGNVLVFSGEKPGPVLVRQVKAPAEAEGKAIDPFYLEIEDVAADEWNPNGVRIVHKAAEDQVAEQRDAQADAAAARAGAKLAKLDAAVPDMALKIWTSLSRAVPRSIRNRDELIALVNGPQNVKVAAIAKLKSEGRIVLAISARTGEGKWYEAH